MFLKAHLDWLAGFPVGATDGHVVWMSRPRAGSPLPTPVRIDREKLRASQFALTKLVHNFPRALPRVVGDVDVWRTQVESVLDCLKEAVHNGRPLATPEPSRSLLGGDAWRRLIRLRAHTGLTTVLDAILLAGQTDLDWLRFMLSWLERHADRVVRFLNCLGPDRVWGEHGGIIDVLIAGELAAQHGLAATDNFIRLISDERSRTVPLTGFRTHWNDWSKAFRKWTAKLGMPKPPTRSAATLQREVRHLLRQTVTLAKKPRRQTLELAELLLVDVPFETWTSAWSELDDVIRTQVRRCRKTIDQSVGQVEVAKVEAIEKLAKVERKLPEVRGGYLCRTILKTGQKMSARLHRVVCDLLRQTVTLDDNRTVRSAVFREIAVNVLAGHANCDRLLKFLQLARKTQGRLQRLDDRDVFQDFLWQPTIRDWNSAESRARDFQWGSFQKLCDNLPSRSDWPAWFEAAASDDVFTHDNTGFHAGALVASLVTLTSDVPSTINLADRILDSSSMDAGDQFVLQTAWKIGQDVGDTFREAFATGGERAKLAGEAFVERARLLGTKGFNIIQNVDIVHRHAVASGWSDLAITLLAAGHQKRLQQLADATVVHKQLRRSLPPCPAASVPECHWRHEFPAELHSELKRLAAVVPDAHQRAARILSPDISDPLKVRREIEALETRVRGGTANIYVTTRLQSLKDRLESPPSISPVRMQRLEQRLRNAVLLEVCDQWHELLQTSLRGAIQPALSISSGTRALPDGDQMSLLFAVLELDQPFRKLGLRLLRTAFGNEAWNTAEHPANVKFLEQLESRGINMQPWTDDRARTVADQQGVKTHLRIESDAVEILRMGHYFGTCLSPGDFNFYSAVANAIDINKQVLFARDDRGKVVGRCLLALGDSGAIVTFHAYGTTKKFPFDRLVADFVSELVQDMGTCVANNDHISALVGDSWYDDGPVDHGLSITGESSRVTDVLKSATPADVIRRLDDALHPAGLTELTLPYVLEVVASLERVDLAPPLLDHIVPSAKLPDSAWIRAAALADASGRCDMAAGVIRRHGPEFVAEHEYDLLACGTTRAAADLLLKYAPTLALRSMRSSRARTVRRDEDEQIAGRLNLLANAHQVLGRQRLADRLRERLTQLS